MNFSKKNIYRLEEYFETINVNKNLIRNIELEYMQEQKLNEDNKK